MKSGDLVWYCSNCGSGPHNFELDPGCAECGHFRDSGAHYELVEGYDPPSRDTYVGHALTQASSSLTSTSQIQSGFDSNFSATSNPPPTIEDGVDPKIIFPEVTDHGSKSRLSPASFDESSEEDSMPDTQTDYDSPTGRSTLDSPSPQIQPAIVQKANYLAGLILNGIQFTFILQPGLSNIQEGTIFCTGRGGQSNTPSSQAAPQHSSPSDGSNSSAANFSNKRKGTKRSEEEDVEDEDSSRRKGQAKRRKRGVDLEIRALACPFYKKNRRRCHNRACAGPGWVEKFRLKEHLFRVHRISQCPRCWETFATDDDVDRHLQEPTPCLKRPEQHVFAITPKAKQILQKRQTFTSREQWWNWMFSTIFPRVPKDSIPSPYYDEDDNLSHFDYENDDLEPRQLFDYCRNNLPGRTGEHLERRILELLLSSDDEKYQELLNLIHNRQFQSILNDSIVQSLEEIEQDFNRGPSPASNSHGDPTEGDSQHAPNNIALRNASPRNLVKSQRGTRSGPMRPINWTVEFNLDNVDARTAWEDSDFLDPGNAQALSLQTDTAMFSTSESYAPLEGPTALGIIRLPETLPDTSCDNRHLGSSATTSFVEHEHLVEDEESETIRLIDEFDFAMDSLDYHSHEDRG